MFLAALADPYLTKKTTKKTKKATKKQTKQTKRLKLKKKKEKDHKESWDVKTVLQSGDAGFKQNIKFS